MVPWIEHLLAADAVSVAIFPAVFLLGLLGAVSSCCSLPVLGAVAGYAGARGAAQGRHEVFWVAGAFMAGTMVSLAALGALTGFASQMAGSALGTWWRFAAGLLLVGFGLASFGLVPLRLPQFRVGSRTLGHGVLSAIVYGLVVGGASTACSVGCNPLLGMVVGAAALRGATGMGALIFAVFALGFSLPLAAGLVGIGLGLGRISQVTTRLLPAIRIAAGVLLLGVGFYLLATIR